VEEHAVVEGGGNAKCDEEGDGSFRKAKCVAVSKEKNDPDDRHRHDHAKRHQCLRPDPQGKSEFAQQAKAGPASGGKDDQRVSDLSAFDWRPPQTGI